MRQVVIVILILALLPVLVVAGLWGMRLISMPWETPPISLAEETLDATEVPAENRLTEAMATLESLKQTATAAAVEKGLVEAMATLNTMQSTATAIAVEKGLVEARATLDIMQTTATAIAIFPPASLSPGTRAATPSSTSTAQATPASAQVPAGTAVPVDTSTSAAPQGSSPTGTGLPSSTPAVASAPASTPSPGPAPAMEPASRMLAVLPAAARASSEPACSQDSQGNPVCYPASNIIDGQTATAWRASMSENLWIEVELPETIVVTEIGIVGGYAKIDPYDGSDRWRQNHRPRNVRVYLDGVEEGTHELFDIREWQLIAVEPQPAHRVRLVIVDSYPPIEGNRPYVAISEIRVLGHQP